MKGNVPEIATEASAGEGKYYNVLVFSKAGVTFALDFWLHSCLGCCALENIRFRRLKNHRWSKQHNQTL
jgi:hypothetical protein